MHPNEVSHDNRFLLDFMVEGAFLRVDISIVSHKHGDLVLQCLQSLSSSLRAVDNLVIRVFLTLNVAEPELESEILPGPWPFKLELIHNHSPLGFGANHNQAFAYSQKSGGAFWFAVVNPDIIWLEDGCLWRFLQAQAVISRLGLVCPRQLDEEGRLEDYARSLVTPVQLLTRRFGKLISKEAGRDVDLVAKPDWYNGACMVFRSDVFALLQGFDERYFMYCEDTDICLRLRLDGWSIIGADCSVVHDARRNSSRSLAHLYWHSFSLMRLWCSGVYWRYLWGFKILKNPVKW